MLVGGGGGGGSSIFIFWHILYALLSQTFVHDSGKPKFFQSLKSLKCMASISIYMYSSFIVLVMMVECDITKYAFNLP